MKSDPMTQEQGDKMIKLLGDILSELQGINLTANTLYKIRDESQETNKVLRDMGYKLDALGGR
jgi:hypothetical protein